MPSSCSAWPGAERSHLDDLLPVVFTGLHFFLREDQVGRRSFVEQGHPRVCLAVDMIVVRVLLQLGYQLNL